jgi:5'-methylthioadenosine phosphorylase
MILGVLGGSGLYDIDGLADVRTEEVTTPYGPPSAPVTSGTAGGTRLLFLPRHGAGHRLSPSEINYRANVFALKTLGAERLLSISAVGSLREDLLPGEFVLLDQFIDRTFRRATTFFGDGVVGHVGFADPTCAAFSAGVAAAAGASGLRIRRGGTYLCMEGPQFSTRAESRLHRSWGADVVGMTAAPEAKLAREAELCFAALALVTDYDAWRDDEAAVSVASVIEVLRANVAGARRIVRALAERVEVPEPCGCARAAAHAIITAPDAVPAAARQRIHALLGREP